MCEVGGLLNLDPHIRWWYLRSPTQSGAELRFEPKRCLILSLPSFHPSLVGKEFYSSSLRILHPLPAYGPPKTEPLAPLLLRDLSDCGL